MTAPVVTIYRNGDLHFQGKKLVVNQKRLSNFDNFLDKVTYDTHAKVAVRQICTPKNGTRIGNLEQLRNGGVYVAVGRERFKKLQYENLCSSNPLQKFPVRQNIKPVLHSRIYASARYQKEALAEPLRNRIILVYRNGEPMYKGKKLLLDKHLLVSMDNVLQYITDKVKLRTGAVKCLYTVDGLEVKEPNDLVTGNRYVAVGYDKHFVKLLYNNASHDVTPRRTTQSKSSKSISPNDKSPRHHTLEKKIDSVNNKSTKKDRKWQSYTNKRQRTEEQNESVHDAQKEKNSVKFDHSNTRANSRPRPVHEMDDALTIAMDTSSPENKNLKRKAFENDTNKKSDYVNTKNNNGFQSLPEESSSKSVPRNIRSYEDEGVADSSGEKSLQDDNTSVVKESKMKKKSSLINQEPFASVKSSVSLNQSKHSRKQLKVEKKNSSRKDDSKAAMNKGNTNSASISFKSTSASFYDDNFVDNDDIGKRDSKDAIKEKSISNNRVIENENHVTDQSLDDDDVNSDHTMTTEIDLDVITAKLSNSGITEKQYVNVNVTKNQNDDAINEQSGTNDVIEPFNDQYVNPHYANPTNHFSGITSTNSFNPTNKLTNENQDDVNSTLAVEIDPADIVEEVERTESARVFKASGEQMESGERIRDNQDTMVEKTLDMRTAEEVEDEEIDDEAIEDANDDHEIPLSSDKNNQK